MIFDLVIEGRRVVTPDGELSAAVGVIDGRIAAVLPGNDPVSAHRRVHLADDEVLLPGLVDTHVHVNEPGRTEWEGFASATRAAAAGGVTTVIDMPLNSVPPTVDVAALTAKRAAATGQCHVDVGFWGGAVPDNGGGLRPLHAAGVFGFKCFLSDSGVPEFPPLAEPGLAAALQEIAAFDGLLLVHAEDPEVLANPDPAQQHATRGRRSYEAFLASRPPEAEEVAIARLIALAGAKGARVHVVHLSSARALPALHAARREGVRITAETCPHYLALCAQAVPDGATPYKCCPPIRGAGNRNELWRGLATGGIDMIVSDHSPCPPTMKCLDSGDFAAAWGGIASVELGLPVVWTQAWRRGHTLPEVVRWMAAGPAALAGLPRKGRIATGADGDFCVFAPDESWVVDPADLVQRHGVTPYAQERLRGVIRATWLRGSEVDGEVATGRLLAREEP